MSARTLTAKILEAHAQEPAAPDSAYVVADVDVILGHEATIALVMDRFKAADLRIRHPERCLFAGDHFVPPATPERADILRRYIEFCEEQGIAREQLFQGISHQLMVEDPRCIPGTLICGADSHTTMAGALSCFAAGFGSTDILAILATGQVRLQIPESVEMRVHGRLRPGVLPKDLALTMMKLFGEGGATGLALEWIDEDGTLPVPARATVSNMAVDCGAKNALWAADAQTSAYLERRDGRVPDRLGTWRADEGATYISRHRIDLASIEPLVARPGSPADAVPVSQAAGEKVHQVVIGSCTSGDGEDIRQAARALQGKKIAPGLRLVVTPASQTVYLALMKEGALASLIESGALITAPSCGACGGIDKGLLGAGEVCVSTSNRNFRGRMGHPDARVYLASGLVAAASALTGRVTDPAEVFV